MIQTTPTWGLLGPEKLSTERRTRTLGVGAAVRDFNDLAVPGLGGVWFGKQLFLALLGIAVAEGVRNQGKKWVQNIETANAVEALACWLALDKNNWKADSRVLGRTKMRGKDDLSFAAVCNPRFYVVVPMRSSTIQPLRALNLVESNGERFNSFRCSERGKNFIEAVCSDFRPYNSTVLNHLTDWASGKNNNVESQALRQAISPLAPLSERSRAFLREQLAEDERRRAALDWIDWLGRTQQQSVTWERKPDRLQDDHWQDLHTGALFFAARDAAITLLNRTEEHISNQSVQQLALIDPLPPKILVSIDNLRKHAQPFLDKKHDRSRGQMAQAFCQECVDTNHVRLLKNMVNRSEGKVLCLGDGVVLPSGGFGGKQTEELSAGADTGIQWPEGISYRIRNLFLLNLDLDEKLGEFLSSRPGNEGDEQ